MLQFLQNFRNCAENMLFTTTSNSIVKEFQLPKKCESPIAGQRNQQWPYSRTQVGNVGLHFGVQRIVLQSPQQHCHGAALHLSPRCALHVEIFGAEICAHTLDREREREREREKV